MSGPKVVRVVTREELLAQANSVLARLDSAVDAWQKSSGDLLGESDVDAAKKRRDELTALLQADRFSDFGQAAQREIDYLDRDSQTRREKVAHRKAQEAARIAGGQAIARSLLQSAPKLADVSRDELEAIAEGRVPLAEMDAVLSRIQRSAFKPEAAQLTDAQRKLAARLGDQVKSESLEAWIERVSKSDVRVSSVLTYLAEMELLGAASDSLEHRRTLDYVKSLDDGPNRDMRLDSLVLAVRKSRDAAKAKDKALRDVSMLAAELTAMGGSDLLSELRAADSSASLEALESLQARGRDELAKLQASAAAQSRRRAILQGLEQMGYQVQDGLSTATSESGRLVLRTPADDGYGVEVVSGGTNKMQVRSVAFSGSRDTSQDIPEERRWCSDFGKLQATLRAAGSDLVIEKALGVGAAPIRVLDGGTDERVRSAATPAAGRAR